MLHRGSAAFLVGCAFAGSIHADHFDDHQLAALQGIAGRPDVLKNPRISLTELSGLPKVVQGSPQSVLLVVRTDEGNWCKLLVRGGGVKRKGAIQPRPFLQIERLVSYSADSRRGILADRRDVYLFAGFSIDLDLGQIVSKGDGHDLAFDAPSPTAKSTAKAEMMVDEKPRLGPLQGTVVATSGVDLYVPRTALASPSRTSGKGKSTGPITIADYIGKHRLDVDGRFTGVLQIREDDGKLRGSFVSDQSGATYEATGSVGPPQQVTLSIAFPMTDLKLDGRLFTRNRSRIAGSASMEENRFGFVAERID